MKNIRTSFMSMLEQADWMDNDSKVKAVDKVKGVLRKMNNQFRCIA